MEPLITDQQWAQYVIDGYLRLGRTLDDDQLKTLQDRIDAIMLGEADVDYDRIMMQLDSASGEYGDAGEQSKGHKGATLNYRKIQNLEQDPTFLRYIQRPLFNEICARTYGRHVPVGVYRTMFMNKPAGRGTKLPWHQDRWRDLDRDPLVTVWTALDPATIENGCVAVIPGSHRYGVVNAEHHSGFLSDDMAAELCREDDAVMLELEPGESVLLHNWVMHGSDKNHSNQSRRALSVCYMDARTGTASQGGPERPVVFGEGALCADSLSSAALNER